ncbi:hypothetical protein MCOR25_009800 [Pyricularia grisea]|nr:hypothetical protein MCOR25_009800 [Pyricularia grisea]
MPLYFPTWTNPDRCRCDQCWIEYRIRQRASLAPRPEPLWWTLDYAGEWAPVYVEPNAWRLPAREQRLEEPLCVAGQDVNHARQDGTNAVASSHFPPSGTATEAILPPPPPPPRLSPFTTPPISPLPAHHFFEPLPQFAPLNQVSVQPSARSKSTSSQTVQDEGTATPASVPTQTILVALPALVQVTGRHNEQNKRETEEKRDAADASRLWCS